MLPVFESLLKFLVIRGCLFTELGFRVGFQVGFLSWIFELDFQVRIFELGFFWHDIFGRVSNKFSVILHNVQMN